MPASRHRRRSALRRLGVPSALGICLVLAPAAVAAGPSTSLDFSSEVPGTIEDGGGQGTGFTSVFQHLVDDTPLLDASLIDLVTTGDGTLAITSTEGDFVEEENTQTNALQVDATADEPFVVRTVFTVPAPTDLATPYQGGGIFVATGQDNYAKLVLNWSDEVENPGPRFQLAKEEGGVFDVTAPEATLGAGGVAGPVPTTPITLEMTVVPAVNGLSAEITGSYSVEGGVSGTLGPFTFAPLDTDGVTPLGVGALTAGLVTTNYSDPAAPAAPVTFTFDEFSALEQSAPSVVPTSLSPESGRADVATDGTVSVTFSEPMDLEKLQAAFGLVRTSDGTPVAGTVALDGAKTTATFTPAAALEDGTEYEATVAGTATDLAGNALEGGATTWSFATAPAVQPPVTEPPVTTPPATTSPGPTATVAQSTAEPAPTSGSPVCNAVPERREGTKGTIRLTKQALVIQQRIDAAALRRLNAANDWIDRGIVPTDLCATSFGPDAFQSGITWVGGASVPPATPPTPRDLNVVTKTKKPGDFTVDLRQIRINDRISRALLARANATWTRINNLTGGNLATGARLGQRPLYAGLMTSGALPPSADGAPTPLEIGTLPSAGTLRVSVAQLRKTQRRSQQAIVIANRVNDQIMSGLTQTQFVPGSIGVSRLG